MKISGGLLIVMVLLAQPSFSQRRSAGPQASTAAEQPKSGTQQALTEDAESELTRLLNDEREKHGLQPLARDQRLEKAAREHSLRMADQHVLSHGFSGEAELPERLASAGIRFDRSGENVAFGPTAQQVHDGLMKSPPHRANILNPEFDSIGVGVVLHDGLLWVTQDFAHRLEFRTEEAMENLIARKFEQARRQSGKKPARRERTPGLRAAACSMAQKGKLDTSRARDVFGGRAGAAAFSGADFSDLPSQWRQVAEMPALQRYAVGVCFRESEQFPSGGYWAVLVFE
jgi:uncharacterized protein YkwD